MSYAAHVLGASRHKRYFPIIQRAAESALRETQAEPGEVSIAVVDEAEMRELNRRYAGADEATDVLSFESGASDPASGLLVHGDIAICLPIAQAQAEGAGHDLEAELALLTVHGVLHLTGYDHAKAEDRRRMWERQAAVLHRLGHTFEMPLEGG
jgi:probable rRNA maturation factor